MENGVFWVVTPCGSCKNQRATRRNNPEDTILYISWHTLTGPCRRVDTAAVNVQILDRVIYRTLEPEQMVYGLEVAVILYHTEGWATGRKARD
jgi:hypothetical protein